MYMKKTITVFMNLVLIAIFCSVAIPIEQQQPDTKYYSSGFYGASDFVEVKRYVSYAEQSKLNKRITLRTPSYVLSGVTCVPIAATNIIGFYDRYYDELIPNFTAGTAFGNNYLYAQANNYVTNVAHVLATDMGLSDPEHEGATVEECKTGLTKYCKRKSLTISYNSCMSSGSFNYALAKEQLLSGKPIIIFCSEFNLSMIATENSVDTITLLTSSDAHAMVVFGYTEISYIQSNGTSFVENYLYVASGLLGIQNSLLYLGQNITIDNAYAITIFRGEQ